MILIHTICSGEQHRKCKQTFFFDEEEKSPTRGIFHPIKRDVTPLVGINLRMVIHIFVLSQKKFHFLKCDVHERHSLFF